jgi:hypothetical protein
VGEGDQVREHQARVIPPRTCHEFRSANGGNESGRLGRGHAAMAESDPDRTLTKLTGCESVLVSPDADLASRYIASGLAGGHRMRFDQSKCPRFSRGWPLAVSTSNDVAAEQDIKKGVEVTQRPVLRAKSQ